MDALNALNICVLQPAEDIHPFCDGPRLVVVDSLDESLVRTETHGLGRSHSVAELVAELYDRAPQWLRVVCSSRPNVVSSPADGRNTGRLATVPVFKIEAEDPANRRDI